MRLQLLSLLSLSLLLASCGARRTTPISRVESPRLISIEVEVYDPDTNLVWENVSVSVVEADQEWSNCTCVSPYFYNYLTDGNGRVFLDEYDLADADVGFVTDDYGAAVIGPYFDEDEATVVLEISAFGFATVYVEVPITWDEPDVFVEVPFY